MTEPVDAAPPAPSIAVPPDASLTIDAAPAVVAAPAVAATPAETATLVGAAGAGGPASPGHARALATVWFTLFLDLVSFGIVIPVLPFYATHFGAPAWLVTLLATAYSAAQFVMAPVLGRLSDRHGRRPVMLISIAGSVAAMLTLGLAQALWMVFLARIISGMCNANVSTAHAYVADRVPPNQRARYMGMMGTAVGLGFIFGPTIGGLLSRPDHPELPFLVGAGLSAANWLMAFFWLPESHRPGRLLGPPPKRVPLIRVVGDREFWRSQLGVLVMVSLGFFLAFAAMESTFALYTEAAFAWTARETGQFFSLIGAVIVIVQGGLVGRAVGTFGERRTLIFGLCSLSFGFAAASLAPAGWVLPFVAVFIAGGNGLIMPSLNALISRNSTADSQGVNMGLTQSAGALGRICGPMLAGAMFELVAPGAPLATAGVMGLIVAFVAFALIRELRPDAGR